MLLLRGKDLCCCSLLTRFYRIRVFARSTCKNKTPLPRVTHCTSLTLPQLPSAMAEAHRDWPSRHPASPTCSCPSQEVKRKRQTFFSAQATDFSGFWSALWPAALRFFQSSLTIALPQGWVTPKQSMDLSRLICLYREHGTLMPTLITFNHAEILMCLGVLPRVSDIFPPSCQQQ